MFALFFLLSIVSMLALLVGLIKPELVLRWGENKSRSNVVKIFGSAAILLFILSMATTPEITPEQEAVIAQRNNETAADAENEAGNIKDYINNSLDPLIRSVSSNVDTNWQFYFIEPVERFAQDGNLEYLQTDIKLCADLFKGIIQQIDTLEIPDYLSDEDVNLISEIKDGLQQSVSKRVEAIDLITKAQTVDEAIIAINSDEVANKIFESNNSIITAAQTYERLLKKYEE